MVSRPLQTMLAAILALASLPTLCVSAGSAEVFLYPTPSPVHAGSLGILAHHLGLEAFESLETLDGQIALGGAQKFVANGQTDALLLSVDANHPDHVMPQALQPSFLLPLSIDSTSSLLQHYSHLAHKTYHSVADAASQPSSHRSHRFLDIFSLSSVDSLSKSEAVEKFMMGINRVVSFVEESQQSENADRFGAFEVNGLKDIEAEWGRDSEQYLTATATLRAAIQSAMANELSFAVIFPSRLSTRQLAQPPQSPFPPPNTPDTAPVFSTSTCFTSVDACRNATATCSSRGDCVSVTRAGRTCFVCQCGKAPLKEGGKNISWAGSMCQKKDISQEFTLIVGTVIFLILISVGSISLLYTIGNNELPGVLTGGAAGGPLKHE